MLQKLMLQNLRRSGPLILLLQTVLYKLFKILVLDQIKSIWKISTWDLLIDLGRILAFIIRDIPSDHLKDTHAKSVNINTDSIGFFIHLRCHKLRSSKHRMSICRFNKRSSKAKITDPDLTCIAIYEDILTFDIPVDDRKRFLFMEIDQPFENFLTPVFDDF